MADIISRADVIEEISKGVWNVHELTDRIEELPSAEIPKGELISRADAIELLTKIVFDEPPYLDSETLCRLYAEEQINALPSAEADIKQSEYIIKLCEYQKEIAEMQGMVKLLKERVAEMERNKCVYPSAEAVQGEWVDIDNYYRMATCSRCHKVTMFEKWGEYIKPYDFCPNCGAIMYKGGDNNEIG